MRQLLPFVIACCSCAQSATVGPVVTHVQPLEGGAIRMRRCELYISAAIGDSGLEHCHTTTVQPVKP